MENLTKNIATDEADFQKQKQEVQEVAEVGELAGTIAAKLPVSPQTVIEGIMIWRRDANKIIPAVAVGVAAVIGGVIAYRMYGNGKLKLE